MTSQQFFGAVTALIGAVVGFALARLAMSFDRSRRRKAHLAALSAEVTICERLAKTYLTDPVLAPLYRLPTAAFTTAFPGLLADSSLSEKQVHDLDWFSIWVGEINRGFDNAHRALEANDNSGLSREANRLRLKCRNGLEDHERHEAYVKRARWAIAQG